MLASLAFFGFAAGHAILLRGVTHASVFFMIASGVSLTFEMIGLRTGLIYGDYYYTDRLGPKLF
ncbi:MAG: carotenoid biosynthesis protein, partial [Anaerolineae bacterium]|nr:carotenoid biosynthesis protein [Anaerolineae bacterium]